MRQVIFYLILSYVFSLSAQNGYEKGKLIDSVPVANSNNETFALYLPKSFDPNNSSSAVFIFDPAGRGKVGISAFIEAAETYNHILVCSNDSKNGPYARNFEITDRLFDHVFSSFSIMENQIYLAGFSGGSRLVTAIASLTDQIEGVVACGAGFSGVQSQMPSTQKFSYVGICGDGDMNYLEMLGVKDYLQRLNFNHTLITYDGNHSWPPPKEMVMAFDWLKTQSLKKGHISQTDDEIYKSYLVNYKMAKKAEIKNNPLRDVENYERIVDSYNTFYNLDSLLVKLKNIRNGKAYKRSLKSAEKTIKKETALTESFYTRFSEDYERPEKASVVWWTKEIGKLNEIDGSTAPEINKMVERVRFKIFAMARSRINPLMYSSNGLQKELCNTICRLIYPNYQQQQG